MTEESTLTNLSLNRNFLFFIPPPAARSGRAYYSVHYSLVGQRVDARLAAHTVEIFQRGALIATHPRATRRYQRLTIEAHRPPQQAYRALGIGMYPLPCNDRALSPAAVLTAHKGQPTLEKRFEQTKTVHEIAPVFLKSPARIEALFTLYFMVLLVQALIERELRRAMRREQIDSLPLYPETRPCKRPTTELTLRLFALAERHTLTRDTHLIQVFHPELNSLQRQVLALLGVNECAFSV